MPTTKLGVVQLQAGFDQQLLGERVAHLDRRATLLAALVEGGTGEYGDAADAVPAGLGAHQHDDVARSGGRLVLQPVDRQYTEREGVDQRVPLVGGVEDDLAADVRQAEAVAVPADAGHHAGQHAGGVGVVDGAEAQRVHHRDRAGAHGEDVADDAADAGCRALVGLDVAGVVVRLDLERDGELVRDLDHARVLTDAGEHPVAGRRLLAELAQVHLARLVRAVLAPHDRVHGQLGLGRPAVQDLPDPVVLVVAETELGVRLKLFRGVHGPLDGVEVVRVGARGGVRPGGLRGRDRHRGRGLRGGVGGTGRGLVGRRGHPIDLARRRVGLGGHAGTPARCLRTEVKKPRPSSEGPVNASTACSGCGMMPTTLPASLVIAAMSRSEPFGLPRW